MRDSPASVVFDEDGNAIGVIQDGAVYRFQVEAALKPGTSVSLNATPSDPANIYRELVKASGSDNLLVDGSGTEVVFSVGADPTKDILINEIRFVLTAREIRHNGDRFGPISTLTNGVLLETYLGSTPTQLANIKITEDFYSLYSPGGITLDRGSNSDLISAGVFLGGAIVLSAGSGDLIRVTIRDDLTGNRFEHFRCTVFGVKQ